MVKSTIVCILCNSKLICNNLNGHSPLLCCLVSNKRWVVDESYPVVIGMLLKGFSHIHCILLPIQIKKINIRISENLWSVFKFLLFPHSSVGKESSCSVGDLGSIPGFWSRGEGKGYPLQYCGLENSMDCIAHGIAKSQTWLSDFHFTSL